MHFVISASSNYAVVLHNVTPIDLLAQSVVLWRTHHLGQALACPTYIHKLRFCTMLCRLSLLFVLFLTVINS